MKIYTNEDWEQATREVEAAEAAVAAIVEKQAEQRYRIAVEKEALDAELDGPISKRAAALSKKFKLQEHLLGPWIVDCTERWESATIYDRGREEDVWARRGWLRVMLKSDPVWALDYGKGRISLGKPTEEPGDFEARLEEASNILIKAGFILPE